jgi:hypothetical protein
MGKHYAVSDPKANDPAFKQRAYELWTHIYGRNSQAVRRHFAGEPPEGRPEGDEVFGVVKLEHSVIKHWALEGDWSNRAAREIKGIIPSIWENVHTDLALGSVEGVRWGRQLLQGKFDDPAKGQFHIKEKVRAMEIFFDRAGHQPWTKPKEAAELPVPEGNNNRIEIGNLSEAELEEMVFGQFRAKSYRMVGANVPDSEGDDDADPDNGPTGESEDSPD